MKDDIEKKAQEFLDLADVKINGNRPWDIKVNNPRLYSRVIAGGSLDLGESYMDGWWDCNAIDQLADRILRARLQKKVRGTKHRIWLVLKSKLINMQSRSRAYEVGGRHYDIGNDFYKLMLDKRMTYSCGFWDNAQTLDEAQEAKLKISCEKLGIKPGMTVLDIGCGWGSFVKYAAEQYDVKKIVGITISKKQAEIAEERCKDFNNVEIRVQDYRNLDEQFDRIISIGMMEHVGYKNYRKYMEVARKCLKPDGRFLLHTIGGNTSVKAIDPWINKYIFPNAVLPSAKQITTAAEGLFTLEDWHNYGLNYDKTLMAWHSNFIKGWDQIKDHYSERFRRMWEYYLLCYAGTFRSGMNQLWQIMFL